MNGHDRCTACGGTGEGDTGREDCEVCGGTGNEPDPAVDDG